MNKNHESSDEGQKNGRAEEGERRRDTLSTIGNDNYANSLF